MTEDEMVGWHHRLNGHEFEQTLGDGEGQGSLACCSPWGRKESDTTERLNSTNDGHSFYPLKGVMQHKCKLDKLGGVCVCVCVCVAILCSFVSLLCGSPHLQMLTALEVLDSDHQNHCLTPSCLHTYMCAHVDSFT